MHFYKFTKLLIENQYLFVFSLEIKYNKIGFLGKELMINTLLVHKSTESVSLTP